MLLIKIGGGTNINMDFIAQDLVDVIQTNQVIVVHGANASRDEIAQRMGVPTKTITSPSGVSSVYTDQEAIDIFLMAYAGLVNKRIVETFHKHGINAVGLSGIDGKLWQAKRKKHLYAQIEGKTKLVSDSYTGKVETINSSLISLLSESGYLPVICPPALSHESEIVNTDNDMAIAAMASVLPIDTIVSLFEAPGLLKDHTDESSIIRTVQSDILGTSMEYAQGRMKKKVLGAQKALEAGVKTIHWGDGRVERPISRLFAGEGTVIKQ